MQKVIARLKQSPFFTALARHWPLGGTRRTAPVPPAVDLTLLEAHLNLVELYLQDNRALEALAVVKHVTRLGPQLARAHYLAGRAYVKLRNLVRAEAEFEHCLAIDPTNHASEYDLSLVKIAQGKLDDASVLLENVRLKDPTDPRPQLILTELSRLQALA